MTRDPYTVEPHLEEFKKYLNVSNNESHRGAALVACSFLEELLGETIRGYATDGSAIDKLLDTAMAPLGSLSARTIAAHCFGLISDRERDEIDNLRRIRNRLAHGVHTSFSDPDVVKICGKLTFSAPYQKATAENAPGIFKSSAVAMVLNLINRPHYVSQERTRCKAWPY